MHETLAWVDEVLLKTCGFDTWLLIRLRLQLLGSLFALLLLLIIVDLQDTFVVLCGCAVPTCRF